MAATLFRRLLAQPQAASTLLQQTCGGVRPFQLVQAAALSASAAAAASSKLLGAVVFERLPVIIPEEPEWEREYREWQQSVRAKYYKQLPSEFIDAKESEMADEAGPQYEPAPRITEADKANDRRSLKRRLDQRLFMLVRPKGGAWSLPQQENQEGETMRQTAERALAAAVNTEAVQPYFVGNAPAGHVEVDGATLFFHRCQLIQGTPVLKGGSGYGEHVWVAKDELGEYINKPQLLDLLQKML
ncbi:hypothetical protein ABPG77_001586 [Micractinium sp. CCAP 211/92]